MTNSQQSYLQDYQPFATLRFALIGSSTHLVRTYVHALSNLFLPLLFCLIQFLQYVCSRRPSQFSPSIPNLPPAAAHIIRYLHHHRRDRGSNARHRSSNPLPHPFPSTIISGQPDGVIRPPTFDIPGTNYIGHGERAGLPVPSAERQSTRRVTSILSASSN